MHLDRMVYKRKLKDQQRMQAVKDLIGDTKVDIQVADFEDPLAVLRERPCRCPSTYRCTCRG